MENRTSEDASQDEKPRRPSRSDYFDFVSQAHDEVVARMEGIDQMPSQLALTLNRASGILTSVTTELVHKPCGLTWSDFQALFVVWVLREAEQSELTALTHMTKATTSNLVRRLEHSGLVTKRPSPHDKRTFLITLTDSGNAVVEKAYRDQNDVFTQWTSVLDADERNTLIALLVKLMDRRDIFST